MATFCLTLPETLHQEVKAITSKRKETMTSYIRSAVAARVTADITGQRQCADNSPCILSLMPQYQAMSKGARLLINQNPSTN